MTAHGRGFLLPQADVEHFHDDRERHREIDVALRHVGVEAVGDQRDADHHQEGQRQHLDRGVVGNEIADGGGEQHHQAHRHDHGRDHDLDLIHHADGRDDRVEGEHDVDQDDLEDDRAEGGRRRLLALVIHALDEVVDLLRALPDQEKAAQDQDDVPSGNFHGR